MNKPVMGVFVVVVVAVASTQVLAASSISTRVKVVEEKIRMHDKKLRDLAAQQELTNKQIESLKQAREMAEKSAMEKAAQEKQNLVRHEIVKAKQKRQEEQAKVASEVSAAKTDVALQMNSEPNFRYAFP